jgi:hypothetical protein
MKGKAFTFADQRDFVRAWQESESVADVCRRTGMEPTRTNSFAVSTRAGKLRDLGVPLKKFRPRSHKDERKSLTDSEIAELARLSEETLP